MSACCVTRPERITALDNRLVPYDARASIAHAEMLHAQGLLTAEDCAAIRTGSERDRGGACARRMARSTRGRRWSDSDRDTVDGAYRRSRQARPPRPLPQRSGAHRNPLVLARCRRRTRGKDGPASPHALDELSARDGLIHLPGYTHMQQAMPSSVALWAGGYAAELRDDAEALRSVQRRLQKNPLGSAAGYGRRSLPLDRAATTRSLELRLGARTGHGRPTVARQGRSATAVRNRARHAGRRAAIGGSAPLLYAGILVRRRCPTPSLPAHRSCRRSATPMSSS